MGCGTSGVIKCILHILNVLWAIGGLALIALAFLSLDTESATYISFLIFGGAIILIIGVLGCWGIYKQDVRLTTTYAIVIAVLLFAQIVAIIVSYGLCTTGTSPAKDVENAWMEEMLIPGAMDNIQQKYHCCGQDSPDDYYSIDRDIPPSCYPNKSVHQNPPWKIGCTTAAGNQFTSIVFCPPGKNWKNLFSAAAMLMLAIYLVKHFRNKQRGLSQA